MISKIERIFKFPWACLAAQLVKNPPAVQETWVRSLGWEDPLEKEIATHSSVLAWTLCVFVIQSSLTIWTVRPHGL